MALQLDVIVCILSQDPWLIKRGMMLNKAIRARLTPIFLAQFGQTPISQTELLQHLAGNPDEWVFFNFDRLPFGWDFLINSRLSVDRLTTLPCSGGEKQWLDENCSSRGTFDRSSKRPRLLTESAVKSYGAPLPTRRQVMRQLEAVRNYDTMTAVYYSIDGPDRYNKSIGISRLSYNQTLSDASYQLHPHHSLAFTPETLMSEIPNVSLLDVMTTYQIYQRRFPSNRWASTAREMVLKHFDDAVANSQKWSTFNWLAQLQLCLYLFYNTKMMDLDIDIKNVIIPIVLRFDQAGNISLTDSILESDSQLMVMQKVKDYNQILTTTIRQKLEQL